MEAENYLIGLNDKQLEAVEALDNYVRVIAGAGSGKTRVLTTRVSYLIDIVGIDPSNILAVTFTNKAAREMKARVHLYLGELAAGAWIMTFGALETRIIREDGQVIGWPSNYQILDEQDANSLVAKVLKDTKDEMQPYFQLDRKLIVKSLRAVYGGNASDYSQWLLKELDELQERIDALRGAVIAHGSQGPVTDYILFQYLYEKRKSFGCDFDDLPLLALEILHRSDKARDKWSSQFQYITVDEYQDVDGIEVELLKILQEKYHNLFIVGDPDQTIYSFRGSNVRYILDFDKMFSPAKTFLLTQNYRSGDSILNVSNTLIRKNKKRIDKQLTPEKEESGRVVYFHAKTPAEEAKFVADNILSMHEQGLPFKDMAVLYRAHYLTRNIEEAFRTAGKEIPGQQPGIILEIEKTPIPYKITSGVGFYQRFEIKNVIGYIRLLLQGDDLSFLRVANYPTRGVGPKTMNMIAKRAKEDQSTLLQAFLKLVQEDVPMFTRPAIRKLAGFIEKFHAEGEDLLNQEHPLSDLMMLILNETDMEAEIRNSGEEYRLDNLAEFKQSLVEYEESFQGEPVEIEEYLQSISLLTSQDTVDQTDNVTLMTVHTAKGLEYPVVFVIGLNEGIFPSTKIRSENEMEEERRLAYVAFTRAENYLLLSDSEGFTHDGSRRYPSRFIFDAEKVGIEYLVELDEELVSNYRYLVRKPAGNIERGGFIVGDKVHHKILGPGEVVEIDENYLGILFESKEQPMNIAPRVLKKITNS